MASERLSSCLFCDVAQGRIQPATIFENDRLMAFLDICPIRKGHVQIIPREHFSYFEEISSCLASEIMVTGQMIARAQKRLYKVERVAFFFTGGDIAHAHAHLVPMHEKTDITSRRYIEEEHLTFSSTPRSTPEELEAIAAELKGSIGNI